MGCAVAFSMLTFWTSRLPGNTPSVPYALKLNDPTEPWQAKYKLDEPDRKSLRVVPLVEPIHAIRPNATPPMAYPWNFAGKTPHSSMAMQITTMLKERNQQPITTVHSCVARSGEAMTRICKGGGTNAYRASMFEAQALTRIAKQEHHHLEYDAIILTHGETDAGLGNMEYEQQLFKFHNDYIQDLQAITGQKHAPVLIQSQQTTCPTDARDTRISPVIQAQWRSQLKAPNMMICAGPKYQYSYADGLHLPAPSYNRLGEKYGQVFYYSVIEQKPWKPLSPTHVSLKDPQTIRVQFHVPFMPLRWDNHLWQPHADHCKEWCHGRGFEVRDSHGKMVEIRGVQINEDAASVSIQLGSAPSHFPLTLGYAMMCDSNNTCGGRPGGRVGHLTDSDKMVGAGAEKIKVRASQGSNKLECVHGKFARRAAYDLVEGGHFSIVNFDHPVERNVAILDRAWDSKSGEYELFFQHNHRNYCVAFAAWVRQDGFSFYVNQAGGSSSGFPGSQAPADPGDHGGFGSKLKSAGKHFFG